MPSKVNGYTKRAISDLREKIDITDDQITEYADCVSKYMKKLDEAQHEKALMEQELRELEDFANAYTNV